MHRTLPPTLLVVALIAMSILVAAPPVTTSAGPATVSLSEVAGFPRVFRYDGADTRFETLSTFSSPAVADVTGDGHPDVIVGGMNSPIRVLDLQNDRDIPLDPGNAIDITGAGIVQASPSIGDINGDGIDDVVVANMGARVAAYSVVGGSPVELYNRYVPPAFDGIRASLFPTPAIGYLDLDRSLDVVTTSWGMVVDGFSGPTGTPMPKLHHWLKDSIWSSPVIGDVDGDGQDEIVVGADCEGLDSQQPCYGLGQGGYVWAFNLDGSVQWSYFVRDAVVWSTPALIDLTGDGALDVVVGTGLFFDRPAAHKVMAINGKTGALLWDAPTPARVMGSPAVGLVDGQPRVWIVSGGGYLMSWDGAGRQIWQQCITDSQECSPGVGTWGGVAVADVNADGRLDAVVQGEARMNILDAATGERLTSARSTYANTLLASSATPTVATVAGKTWIVMTNMGDTNGNFYADARDDLVVTVWTTGTGLGAAPWPTFKGNMARTGGTTLKPPDAVPPGGRRCFAVSGSPGDAAVVNLTPVKAEGHGYGLLTSSDVATAPVASNVNYAPGTTDPNVAVATVGPDGKVCYHNANSSWVHLVADHLGTIDAAAYTTATGNGAPLRKVDTRNGQGGSTVPPGGRVCFPVSGAPGDAAIVNLTPVRAQGVGHGVLTSSSVVTVPNASNVNYATGTTDPNVAVATIGPDGQVCYHNANLVAVDLVADHLGTIATAAYTPATADGAPLRKIDTRSGDGAPVASGGRVCFPVSGSPGDAAVVNLTPVKADAYGYGLLTSSDIMTAPIASNVNYAPGTTDPNVAVATIGPDGQVCYHNADTSGVHLVADHLGTIAATAYTPATGNGAPLRKIDTRKN